MKKLIQTLMRCLLLITAISVQTNAFSSEIKNNLSLTVGLQPLDRQWIILYRQRKRLF